MWVIIVCFASLIFITFMLYVYLVLTGCDKDVEKIKEINKDIANSKTRILILEYMEKHNTNTLNLDDILTIFPIKCSKGERK